MDSKPKNTSKIAIVILVDSVSSKRFRELLASGYMPNVAEFLRRNDQVVRDCFTSLPTASISTHTSILTGLHTPNHGIAGLRWLNRQTRFLRTYLGPSAYKINTDLQSNVKTLFESIDGPTACVNEPLSRGATTVSRLIPYQTDSKLSFDNLFKAIKQPGCEFALCWLHKTDEYTHRFGPDSDEFADEFRKIDSYFGQLISLLEDNRQFKDYLVIVTADHGSVSVSKHVDLFSVLRSAGFAVRGRFYHRLLKPRKHDIVVAVQGDRAAQIYLPTSDRAGHSVEHARYVAGLIESLETFLASREEIGIIMTRVSKNLVNLTSSCGRSLIQIDDTSHRSPKGWKYKYSVVLGDDPLQYTSDPVASRLIDGRFHEHESWLRETLGTKYPGAVPSSCILLNSEMAGDIVALAKEGFDLKGVRLGWRLGRHQGSHGAATTDEILTPLIIGGSDPRINRASVCEHVSIAPTVMDFLDRDYSEAMYDGDSLMEQKDGVLKCQRTITQQS